jgi:hypothetical protein
MIGRCHGFVYDLKWRSVAAYLAGDDSPKER